jgi:predicted nucleic acid-binding protein
MLLDTNIIIYAAQNAHPELRPFIAEHTPFASVISYIEALGFSRLPPAERSDLEAFFEETRMLPLSQSVMEEAVRLKQIRKMSLGDSVVAATALVHGLTLVTRNIADFRWIQDLKLQNPLT